jgi:hypothetical protein
METLPLQLYTKVIIPPAVQAEFGGAVEGYIVQRQVIEYMFKLYA